jgi:CRISPR/Cas system-associated exonuclease Cas4 (RecB family)
MNGKETIVVDFKFAAPNIDHQRQVAQYMHLLSSMGYSNVKGYLWYVYTNKIEEVNA